MPGLGEENTHKNRHNLCCRLLWGTSRQGRAAVWQRLCTRRIRSMCSRGRGLPVARAAAGKGLEGEVWQSAGVRGGRIPLRAFPLPVQFLMQSCRLMCQLLKRSLASLRCLAMMSLHTYSSSELFSAQDLWREAQTFSQEHQARWTPPG